MGNKTGPRGKLKALFSADLYIPHWGASRAPAEPPLAICHIPIPKSQSGSRGVSPNVHCLPTLLFHARPH